MDATYAKEIGFINLRIAKKCIEEDKDFKEVVDCLHDDINIYKLKIKSKYKKHIKNNFVDLIHTYNGFENAKLLYSKSLKDQIPIQKPFFDETRYNIKKIQKNVEKDIMITPGTSLVIAKKLYFDSQEDSKKIIENLSANIADINMNRDDTPEVTPIKDSPILDNVEDSQSREQMHINNTDYLLSIIKEIKNINKDNTDIISKSKIDAVLINF